MGMMIYHLSLVFFGQEVEFKNGYRNMGKMQDNIRFGLTENGLPNI